MSSGRVAGLGPFSAVWERRGRRSEASVGRTEQGTAHSHPGSSILER